MTRPDRALTSADFRPETPLNRFFAWNEARSRHDRRYDALRAVWRLERDPAIRYLVGPASTPEAAAAAARVLDGLDAAIGTDEIERHAALFEALEAIEDHVDLAALPVHQPPRRRSGPKRILVIKLSALGDFIQALGPMAAIRRHHRHDHITLLTTKPFAAFAEGTGHFDAVRTDRRAPLLDIGGWLGLRRMLRAGRFDRVYDLQTSQRSSSYAQLWWPDPRPEWSGIANGCSHPHADLERDPQHTIAKQAEQLLMAGIHPTPLPALPAESGALAPELAGRRFALMIPGSSPGHPGKRWPAERYGELARALVERGLLPVVLGGKGERGLAETIAARAPQALDLTGRTELADLVALSRAATVTIGNDTGVSHIAAAGGHPLVVLFSGESEPSRCAPRGQNVTVLRRVPLAEMTVGTVLTAVDAAIAG
ncbi:MAG TPA: glycosyltransferase family 9 protein [Aliidongia sp.]|uniref:glycosyltransferase family 9 protein n=1 Tax=Aliidongia sp. TaxID=1914230 RepID=UPI002DDCB0D3|nr:glycosyltransferase family 9 protein [Aliidongia sp.]HEV2675996.1 glycosyltransferase family 9 protein [Aliidongia sp.]